MSTKVTFIDLFCGAGGSTLGAKLAGAVPLAGIDCWSLAAKTFGMNNPTAAYYDRQLEGLYPGCIKRRFGKIDLMLASPECTNHSPAKGAERRCEKSREKAFQVLRYARLIRPRWIVVENVVQMETWPRFENWHEGLQNLGYRTKLLKLDASDFGVPQTRRRLFIVGDLQAEPTLPRKRPGPRPSVARILKTGPGDGSVWPTSRLFSSGRATPTMNRAKRGFNALGKSTRFLLVYYGSDGAGGWQSLERPLRTITTLDRFALVEPQNGKKRRRYYIRMLQPPELAAAMGFPDDYKWPESTRREKIKLIGNAVCPPVMKAVVESLIS